MADDYVKGLLSRGEVVLIDTRQHWMAAVRYAIRPILLFGLAILLFLVSQWLQGRGGLLGDLAGLLGWVILVVVVVAVIWLPIDLVRWYSRKYVLTNRRAMRLQGVFRKSSFDSSLEQINDIGFEQTVVGRALGYANLTLYTASDTANETYEQLRDGLQFKKAVLDAKEGIRNDAPLTSLPEGFIVKGGTNPASMRADGRLEEAAALDSSDGATTEGVAAPPAAAPEPEPTETPEPAAVEPEAEPEPEPVVPEPEPEPEPVAPEPEPEPVAPEPEPEPEPELVAPEPEPEAAAPEPEPEPEAAAPEEPAEAPEAAPEAGAANATSQDDEATGAPGSREGPQGT